MSKWPIDRSPKRRVSAKLIAVAWILFLELLVATYVYTSASGGPSTPLTFSTSTTTTTATATASSTTTAAKPTDKISVKSAVINNDTLTLDVRNSGPNATELLTITSICTPKFAICYAYSSVGGSDYKTTFVLPAKKAFLANLTGICFMPIPSCKRYIPIANATYYYQIAFKFSDNSTVTVPVSAKDNTTWAPYPTAILGINQTSLSIVPVNLTGVLNVTVGLNDSLPYSSWETILEGYMKPGDKFSGAVLTNDTGCEGSATGNFTVPNGAYNYTAMCAAPVQVSENFTTVLTGVNVGTYYAVVVRDTTAISSPAGLPDASRYPYFAFAEWVESEKT